MQEYKSIKIPIFIVVRFLYISVPRHVVVLNNHPFNLLYYPYNKIIGNLFALHVGFEYVYLISSLMFLLFTFVLI